MDKKRKFATVLVATLALGIFGSGSQAAGTLSTVSATFNDNGTSAVVTLDITNPTNNATLVTSNPLAGELSVNQIVVFCDSTQPTAVAGQCVSFAGGTESVVTSSSTVMQITVTYTSAGWASNLSGATSQGKPHGFVRVTLATQNNAQTEDVFLSLVSGQSSSSDAEAAAPAKYSGPEFSGLSAKGIMTGSSSRLEGKNLDEISSITIDGKPATFKLDGENALDLTLPEGLAPGTYDLVINSSAGKLTHINAIRVREPLKSFSITSRSVGKISEEQYQEHALISTMQVPELNKARCVVNASSLATARAQAQRLCALVKAANPNIETTVIEARSTIKSDAVFARVSYGWTK